MKISEEKYTAWIDGQLSGEELAAFEKELGPDALADKADALKLGNLLRTHVSAPAMANADFFNHQVLTEIQAPAAPARQTRSGSGWALPRMAWAGAGCMAIVLALYLTVVRHSMQAPMSESEYLANVLEMRTGDPAISARSFSSKQNDVTVIWLDGLTYLPAGTGL